MDRKKSFIAISISIAVFLLLSGCSQNETEGKLEKAGMLVEHTIEDEAWGKRGYQGLLKIEENFDAEVYYEEGIDTESEIIQAVESFSSKGVNLIFGHSNIYGKVFSEISEAYPDVHFVYFNGGYYQENVTSMNFNSHAMGFFAGMVAGEMTESDKVALIGAFEWQPEIEGFYEGVNYQNSAAKVQMNFVNSWDDEELAIELFNDMAEAGVDVFYPAGDSFSVPVISRAAARERYAIGFVLDHSYIDEKYVLTSTVQHADQLYLKAAEQFNQGELEPGVFDFDFQDGAISLGDFSPDIPPSFRDEINQAVDRYIETGMLPNEY